MAGFYAATMFVSALLLFLVQPMVGKMILPLLGGTPAVWNTCMVFFQFLLLAGYTYAHVSTQRLGPRRQARWHLLVIALPLLALAAPIPSAGEPVHVVRSLAPQGSTFPFFGVIGLLGATIAVPFFVVSTTAPLLQRWLADTDHPNAADPYFLYGASNLGSLLALGAYPLLLEPTLRLTHQGWLWAIGYAGLAAMIYGCVVRLAAAPKARQKPVHADAAPSWRLRGRWLLYSFVPSSLLLGVTTFATTDVAPIPLLWVFPLALYLTTFIIAFGRHPRWVRTATLLTAPGLMLLLVFLIVTAWRPSRFWMGLAPHFLAFFLGALACHLELVRLRPAGQRSTEFYFWMSLGGVLGGLFNALIAPLVFTNLTEYPLVIILCCAIMPSAVAERSSSPQTRLLDWLIPAIVFVLVLLMYKLPLNVWAIQWPAERFHLEPRSVWTLIALGVPALIVYCGVDRPLRFGLGVGAFWLAATIGGDMESSDIIIRRDRSYFGRLEIFREPVILHSGDIEFASNASPIVIHSKAHGLTTGQSVEVRGVEGNDAANARDWRVTVLDPDRFSLDGSAGTGTGRGGEWTQRGVMHKLVHGTTLHGRQQVEPPSNEPLTYYHRTGPLGQLFRALPRLERADIAAIGLGTGSVAAYGRPTNSITFYEIDPTVRRLAEDERYFTYLRDCPARKQFVMGDARLKLEEHGQPGEYDLIIVDAFSSDAIPVHLLTREAMELYVSRLKDDGVIALHISNRYLDLEPVAARIAKELGLATLRMNDDHRRLPGKQASTWIMLARKQEVLAPLKELGPMTYHGQSIPAPVWEPLTASADSPLWTDDFSNILSVLSWK